MGQKFLPQAPFQANAQGSIVVYLVKCSRQPANKPVTQPIHKSTSQSKVERNYKLFGQLLKQCERHINKYYDVRGLCLSFPARVDELVKACGDRLNH